VLLVRGAEIERKPIQILDCLLRPADETVTKGAVWPSRARGEAWLADHDSTHESPVFKFSIGCGRLKAFKRKVRNGIPILSLKLRPMTTPYRRTAEWHIAILQKVELALKRPFKA
jgi:hypothetical protein